MALPAYSWLGKDALVLDRQNRLQLGVVRLACAHQVRPEAPVVPSKKLRRTVAQGLICTSKGRDDQILFQSSRRPVGIAPCSGLV